jgi:hypothetical protein
MQISTIGIDIGKNSFHFVGLMRAAGLSFGDSARARLPRTVLHR